MDATELVGATIALTHKAWRGGGMKVSTLMRLLPVLPLKESTALTGRQITQKFYKLGDAAPDSAQTRAVQHYLKELCEGTGDDDSSPPLVRLEERPPRYYLRDGSVAGWLMTGELALNLLLARRSLSLALPGVDEFEVAQLQAVADHRLGSAPGMKRLWQRLRVARDGIGRLPPQIDPEVQRSLLQAVMGERKLRMSYTNSAGQRSERDLSIQGLVMKDGTLYVLGTDSLWDDPRPYAAHRIQAAELLPERARLRADFDLDAYIERQYHFSFVVDRPDPFIELALRVAPNYLYHFRERPLAPDQVIEPDPARAGWSLLHARIPETYLLIQFLQSMGAGVELLAPAHLRKRMAEEMTAAARYYADA